MTAYTDFLTDPQRENNYAVTMYPRVKSGSSIGTALSASTALRVASRKFDPTITGTPRRFWPRLVGPPYRASILRAPALTTSFLPRDRGGEIVLGQRHGDLDTGDATMIQVVTATYPDVQSIRDLYFGGCKVTIDHGGRYGDGDELDFADYGRVFTGKMGEAIVGRDDVRIPLRDQLSRFDSPFQTGVFAGLGSALYSSGTSQYVTVGTAAAYNFGATNYTWEFRIWIEALPAADRAIICRGVASTDGYRILLTSTGKIKFETNQAAATQTKLSDTALVAGKWYHVAVASVNSGAASYIYIDGERDVQGTHTAPTTNAARNLYFLRDDAAGTDNPNIFINQIRCWNDLRTDAEISEGANRALSLVEEADASLIGMWRCDEGTGTGAGVPNDYHTSVVVTTPNDGTITGCTWYHSMTGTTDLQGQVLPDVWGFVEAWDGVLIDEARQIYQIHCGPVKRLYDADNGASGAVSEMGGKVTLDTAYTTLATFAAGTTDPGKYDTLICAGGTWVRMGTPPKKFSVSVEGDYTDGTWRTSVADIVKYWVLNRGNDPLDESTELYAAGFTALNAATLGTVTLADVVTGFATKTAMTVLDAVNFMLNSVGAEAWFRRSDGKFTVQRFDGAAALGTPTLTITERDIAIKSESLSFPVDPPTAEVTLNYRRIHAKHDASELIPGLISTPRGQRLAKEWSKYTTTNKALKTLYADAQSVIIDTALTTSAAAAAEGNRRRLLFDGKARAFQVAVRDRSRQIDYLDPVYFHYQDYDADGVKQDRFGTSATDKFVVIGIEELDNNEVMLTFWQEG